MYEYEHLSRWYIKTTLYKTFLYWNKIFKKLKLSLTGKASFFVPTILFVLTLASDRAVLYGNDAFLILVLLAKKPYSSFLKKFSFSRKFISKLSIENVQNFHRFSHKNMPISQTEGYFENPQYSFIEKPMLFMLAWKWNL